MTDARGPDGSPDDSTLANVPPPPVRTPVLRRIVLAVLTLIVLAGVTGFLGVRTGTVTANGDGYAMQLEYAQIARAGLDVPFDVTLKHEGGFDGDIVLAMTADYFDIFEHQGVSPEPDSESSEGPMVYMTFTAPQGNEFRMGYDIYIQGSSQVGASGEVWLSVDDKPLLLVSFTTVLLP